MFKSYDARSSETTFLVGTLMPAKANDLLDSEDKTARQQYAPSPVYSTLSSGVELKTLVF